MATKKQSIPTILPMPQARSRPEVTWNEDRDDGENFQLVGRHLASSGDLFRSPDYRGGLVLVLPDGGSVRLTKGADMAPVIVERLRLSVLKDGKRKGTLPPNARLTTMLDSHLFRQSFPAVDIVTKIPMYLPNFEITHPGYNDGGEGNRIFYTGPEPTFSDSPTRINEFLEAMDFASVADGTNAVGGALSTMLRNHCLGGKPIILVTANRSHAGKDTIIDFMAGVSELVPMSFQSKNWAMELDLFRALSAHPDAGMIAFGNARLEGRCRAIASAVIERCTTDPVLRVSCKAGSIQRPNNIVFAFTSNDAAFNEDILNRGLLIELLLRGDVSDRKSGIENPRYEFLPAHKWEIFAELLGMVERWKQAGMPLDEEVRHPRVTWAKTIGGILKVNGFLHFLGNYATRKCVDDPIQRALGILGAARPDESLTTAEWASVICQEGLVKSLLTHADRDSDKGKVRGTGDVLSRHEGEVVTAETDSLQLTMRLERVHDRSPKCYRFKKIHERGLAESD